MRNKSKKRIKHERHVYVAKLERELKKLRANAVVYDPIVIELKRFLPPYPVDPARYEQIAKMMYEEACRDIAMQLMQSEAIEVTKSRDFSPAYYDFVDCYNFKLRALKRRYGYGKKQQQIVEMAKDMSAAEILNYYRNLYYAEPQVTERGIVANAINDYFKEVAPRAEVAREIFEEIEKVTASVYNDFMLNREGVGMRAHYVVEFSDELDIAIAELKKKFTEEQT